MKLFVAFRNFAKTSKNAAEMWSGIAKHQGCPLAIVLALRSSGNRNKFEQNVYKESQHEWIIKWTLESYLIDHQQQDNYLCESVKLYFLARFAIKSCTNMPTTFMTSTFPSASKNPRPAICIYIETVKWVWGSYYVCWLLPTSVIIRWKQETLYTAI